MLRTTGYAYAPQMLGIFAFIPILGWFASVGGMLWSLAAVIVGMRQAGEMTTMQAVITAVIGFLPAMIALITVTAILT